MVEHKVRVFFEPDTNSLGAEVKIYSETGENIDNILITTESKWKELSDQIQNIDETYIDKDELINILANTQDELINIDATSISGFSIDQLAKVSHNELHKDYYSPINHAVNTTKYGLGDTERYGHVKTVDNLDTNSFVSGEALSAYQGSVLNNEINNLKKGYSLIQNSTFKGVETKVYSDGTHVYVTLVKSVTSNTANNVIELGTILSAAYMPRMTVQSSAHNDSTDIVVLINSEGSIKLLNKSTIQKPYLQCSFLYPKKSQLP